MASGSVHRRKGTQYWDVYWRDNEGKQQKIAGGKHKYEADKKLREILIAYDRGAIGGSMTFAELAKRWLAASKLRVRDATYEQYQVATEHLSAVFGPLEVRTIGPLDVENFLRDFSEGRQPKTVNNVLTILRSIFNRAVEWRILQVSPAKHVKPLRVPNKTVEYFSPEEVQLLLAASEDDWRLLFMTAIYTGMRQAELIGLKWASVDLDAGHIRVTETSRGETKTRHSERVIAIPPSLQSQLSANKGSAKDYVFAGKDGSARTPYQCRYHLAATEKELGLQRLTFHDLRHTYASLAIAAGVNVKQLTDQMGHSDVTLTLNRYGHLLPADRAEAAQRFERYMSGGNETGNDTA